MSQVSKPLMKANEPQGTKVKPYMHHGLSVHFMHDPIILPLYELRDYVK